MIRYYILIMVLLTRLSLSGQPKITSFTPASGPIGTVVTITGINFDLITTNNIVFFGAVKATVSSVSSTSLLVSVPIGSTYEPITVTTLNNNLTAYSSQPFLVTFPGAGPGFTSASFNAPVTFTVGSDPYGVVNIDLDIDGKPDLVTSNYDGYSISILRNSSVINNVSYESHADLPTGMFSINVVYGDLDGDGKQDIIAANWAANTVSIFRNTSTVGSISFAPKIDISIGLGPQGISIHDIDGDGKPDFVVTNVNSQNIAVFKNTGSPGIVSFATPLSFPTGYTPTSVIIRDLDGDAKPDLAVTESGANMLALFRNTSTAGNISFAPRTEVSSSGGPGSVAVGDLDGDGKPDLVVSNYSSAGTAVFRNVSTPGTINYTIAQTLFVPPFPNRVTVGDLDGDGKPEIVEATFDGTFSNVSVFKNTSVIGLINFLPGVDYHVTGGSMEIKLGDVDGDGKPDIITTASNWSIVSVLKNSNCISATINAQPINTSGCNGSTVNFSISAINSAGYQWQENSGSGWVNLADNTVYSGTQTSTLTITAISPSMNLYQYRCIVSNTCGNINSSAASLSVIASGSPTVSITTTSSNICAGTNVTFTATSVNGGSSPLYQWKKNGSNIGTNSPLYSTNGLNNGDIINCVLTSSITCLIPNTATSNSIIMTVNPSQTASVTITSSANNICAGAPISFTAAPIYGGAAPFFQWKKNGINTGTNSISYTDNTLNNGDIITCVMTSNYNCATPNSVVSNQIVMNITPLVTPLIAISASANNICPGTTVIFSSTTTNGGNSPIFQWKKNGIVVGINSPTYNDNAISNGDIISCDLTSSAACLTTSFVTSNSITMLWAQRIPVDLGPDIPICSGTSLIINAQSGYVSYLWQDGSTNSSYTVIAPGFYKVTVADACGVISSDGILISLNPKPANFLPADTVVCSTQSVLLTPNKNFISYYWNTNSVTSSLNINLPGLYWLEVTDNNGCKGRDSIVVLPKQCLKGLFVPNAFTPNGDTKNDLFKPSLFGTVKQYGFTVYNRYGEIVFETKDPAIGWDGTIKGKAQGPGVFVWKCIYQIDNQVIASEQGTFILIR